MNPTPKFPRPQTLWPGAPWPKTLDSHALGEWVGTLHHRPQDLDEGDLLERIAHYHRYVLVEVPLNHLDADEWATCEETVAEYAERAGAFPPVVIDPFDSIIDGTHRVGAAVKRGDTTILAYVGVEDSDD